MIFGVFWENTSKVSKFPYILESKLTEALGEVGLLVDEHLGADDVAERVERLEEVRVAELLGQVVDEQVRAVGALKCNGWMIFIFDLRVASVDLFRDLN